MLSFSREIIVTAFTFMQERNVSSQERGRALRAVRRGVSPAGAGQM